MKCLLYLLLTSSVLPLLAADLSPTLGQKSDLLLDESFSGEAVPKGWNANTGTLRVEDGQLLAGEKSSDQHIGAFRYRLPVQDCAVQMDFQLGSMRIINLGYDPAPSELKKKGHLFSVVVTPKSWSLIEHNDKANPESKTKVHATAKTDFDPDTTYTLLLECKGDEVVAQINGKEPLKAKAPDFHVKKPGLVFRMGGKDGDEVKLDNIKVWALE
ncbi:hypothetical protein SAMN02745166_00019 [Prosthecobacter debontii]|uniref:3-keto-disaccharide hydrolase domain-containing protein n=1 Tax=Prosthecobacter debontii TaxID=48467 RepID=A0A1T4WDL3_9BACT|nr:hypothetical protein [Prosthecobacter debontii]SKA75416.1 hypothetical protein SAMN02745166_00019 [Prosthecobacter debontii]